MIVTPLVGVWIEIHTYALVPNLILSLPLWECGLKCFGRITPAVGFHVTPLVGVWIEILCLSQ